MSKTTTAASSPALPATAPEFKPKVKRNLILPQIKLEQGIPVYIKITGEIFIGKEITSKGKDNEKPADIVHCIDLKTGAESQVVVPAVMKSVLNEEYATEVPSEEVNKPSTYTDPKYIGRCFMVIKGNKPEGKRYFQYEVAEIEEIGESGS